MKENKYDDSVFFEQYSHMPRSEQGLSAAGEWPALKALLPELAGKRVLAVGLECFHLWRTQAGLDLVGPRYFGIDTDYIPVEERSARKEA